MSRSNSATPRRYEVTLGNLEPDARGISVPSDGIVHRKHEGVDVRRCGRQSISEVRRERGDSAPAREVVAEDGESFHSGSGRCLDLDDEAFVRDDASGRVAAYGIPIERW